MPRPRVRYGILYDLKSLIKDLKNHRIIARAIKMRMYSYVHNGAPYDYTILRCIHELSQVTWPQKLSDYLTACDNTEAHGQMLFLELLRTWRDKGLGQEFKVLFALSVEEVTDIHADLMIKKIYDLELQQEQHNNIKQAA